MTALARLALISVVSFGVCAVTAPLAEASSSYCKKKKKKKSSAKKGVTADTLLKWRRAGMTDDEIAARAVSAGYRLSEKDKAKLKKAKARTLIGALEGTAGDVAETEEVEEVVVAEPKPAPSAKAININNITSPEDIDFDDVPPPPGTPKEFTKKEPEKKKLDTSLRPAAPFVEEKPAQVASASKTAPASSKKSAPASSSSSSEPGKKRVVYTAAAQ